MKPAEAKNDLEVRLQKMGFDFTRPDANIAWRAFKEHLGEEIEGARDYAMVEFHNSAYEFQPIRPAFVFDMCRQFGYFDARGNFEGYEQLHLMLYRSAGPSDVNLSKSLFADDGEPRTTLFSEIDGAVLPEVSQKPWGATLLMQWEV